LNSSLILHSQSTAFNCPSLSCHCSMIYHSCTKSTKAFHFDHFFGFQSFVKIPMYI
jgi:hypothetical protein